MLLEVSAIRHSPVSVRQTKLCGNARHLQASFAALDLAQPFIVVMPAGFHD
jgi:hypothetical protein